MKTAKNTPKMDYLSMRTLRVIPTLVLFFVSLATDSAAQPWNVIPVEKQGIWSKNCTELDYTVFLGSEKAMLAVGPFDVSFARVGWAYDLAVLFSDSGVRVTFPLEELERCDLTNSLLAEAYSSEISSFRVGFVPQVATEESVDALRAISLYREGLNASSRLIAREKLSMSLSVFGEIPPGGPIFQQLVAGGIPYDGGDHIELSVIHTLVKEALCTGARFEEVDGQQDLLSNILELDGEFCILVKGTNDLGEAINIETDVECEVVPSMETISFCGMVLEEIDAGLFIVDVEFGTAAEKSGLDWGQEVLGVAPIPYP